MFEHLWSYLSKDPQHPNKATIFTVNDGVTWIDSTLTSTVSESPERSFVLIIGSHTIVHNKTPIPVSWLIASLFPPTSIITHQTLTVFYYHLRQHLKHFSSPQTSYIYYLTWILWFCDSVILWHHYFLFSCHTVSEYLFIQFHVSGSESKNEAIHQAELTIRHRAYVCTHTHIYIHIYFYIFGDIQLNIHDHLFPQCITPRTSQRRKWKGSRIISHRSGTAPDLSAPVASHKPVILSPSTQEDHDSDGYHSNVQQVALQPKVIY